MPQALHRARRLAAAWIGLAVLLLPPPDAAHAQSGQTPKPVEIRFEGRRELGEQVLRKAAAEELSAVTQRGGRRADIDDAAYRMELAYRQTGFAFAGVDYHVEEHPEKIVATFRIAEGPRVVLDKIELAGHSAFGGSDLRSFFEKERRGLLDTGKPVFIEADVKAAAAGIADFYREQGYLDIAVDPPEVSFSEDRTRAAVRVALREGPRYLLRELRFEGDLPAETREPLAALRRDLLGQPFSSRRRAVLQNRIREIFAEHGRPDATVELLQPPVGADGAVLLTAVVHGGEAVTIRGISVGGNERTRQGFILDRIPFRPGEPYSLQKEREAFRALYRTGIFTAVTVGLSEEPGPERTLAVEVVEAPSREVFIEPGWGSYELLRLKIGLRERNLLGTGMNFGTEAKASLKDQGVSASLTDPWFLNTETTASLTGYFTHRAEPSFTQQELGGSLFFSRKFAEHLTATAGYQLRTVALSQVDAQEISESSDRDYDLASVKALAVYDSRDNLFFPARGQRSSLTVEHADSALGGDIGFTRFTAGARTFFQLSPSTVLGLRYDTGLILPAAGEVGVPVSERFFNGGENTVRSFAQSRLGPVDDSGKPTGGLAYNVLNIELRQRIVGNLIGTLFLDLGNVAPNRAPSERDRPAYDSRSQILSDTFSDYFKDFRPGVGFGLQYLLPVGPARLDLAFNPDRDPRRDEDRFAVHFSVGMAF
ncbi:MAG: outer membrane protein assembly factor BamA [Desulfobacterales bacterium]